jgi:hypothetical protein
MVLVHARSTRIHLPIQQGQAGEYAAWFFTGDYIGKVTPVPIPNTAVKLSEPMIVPTSAKVGIAGFLNSPWTSVHGEFFLRYWDLSGWLWSG